MAPLETGDRPNIKTKSLYQVLREVKKKIIN